MGSLDLHIVEGSLETIYDAISPATNEAGVGAYRRFKSWKLDLCNYFCIVVALTAAQGLIYLGSLMSD